ncbi:hypothetical protein CDAR_111161 [Caerostris darwini]|uniref:Uncharacterized protein n=1 Tax=Caerostris darwini TaxID=1538125 RepID=A0AAV4SRN8_9ARAC|nr:hypothetical protein CDAR_111161 [Caerostris darwini]
MIIFGIRIRRLWNKKGTSPNKGGRRSEVKRNRNNDASRTNCCLKSHAIPSTEKRGGAELVGAIQYLPASHKASWLTPFALVDLFRKYVNSSKAGRFVTT